MTRITDAGFTLIELLIVVALLGILLPVGYSVMLDPLTAHAVESTRAFLQADFDKAHRMLDRDIRAAVRVIPAMDELRSGSDSLILEIPMPSGNAGEIESIRVHYSVSPIDSVEPRGKRCVLMRDVFKRTTNGWQQQRSYPVSRTLSAARFTGDDPNWGDVRVVTVDLSYRTKAVHTELVLEQPKVIALRGVSS